MGAISLVFLVGKIWQDVSSMNNFLDSFRRGDMIMFRGTRPELGGWNICGSKPEYMRPQVEAILKEYTSLRSFCYLISTKTMMSNTAMVPPDTTSHIISHHSELKVMTWNNGVTS